MVSFKWSSILLPCLFCIVFSCNSKSHQPDEKKYEQAREILLKEEQKNPAAFLDVSFDDKKNLLGQTVVRGSISNKAKFAAYKDIMIGLSFFSKTGTLLETEKETIYLDLLPGETRSFKTKYFTPRGTDSLKIIVIGAKNDG